MTASGEFEISMDNLHLPSPWYFHNLYQSIYDSETPFSAASFARQSDEDVNFSTSSLRRTLVPDQQWQAFSPSDNTRIINSDGEPIPVGFDRLLFEVVDKSKLRPIYWPISSTAHVHRAHWVFSSSLTPVHPDWDQTVCLLWEATDWKQYAPSLEKALEDPATTNDIFHRVFFEQDNRPISFTIAFSRDGSKAYLFSGKEGAVSSTAIRAILDDSKPRGTLETLQGFNWLDWKQMRNITNISDDPDDKPTSVTHLILVFHGIGQKLSDSFNRVNFVYAIDKLRVNIAKSCKKSDVSEQLPKNTSFLVLAVNWRQAISFHTDYTLESITVPGLPWLRQAFTDAMVDIPLYMCEEYSKLMLEGAAAEANRLYSLVLKHHPGFDKNGKVHLIGHSLGSLITADLLSRQPTDPTVADAPFKFSTTNFFTTGSPLGLFLLLRKRYIEPRYPDSPQEFGCFAIRSLYNIVHPSDMVCLRLSATIKGGGSSDVEPSPLPPWDGPMPTSRLAFLSNGRKRVMSWVRSYPETDPCTSEGQDASIDSKVSEGEEDLPESLNRHILDLNDNGQIDWILQPPGGALGNQYVKLFTAHFEYWSTKELARFVAIECGRRPGREFTVKEHRAPWMSSQSQT